MNPLLEILSQGDEVVTGQIADTNAAWLSQETVAMGFNVMRHTAVGDKLDDLVRVLTEISIRADCCICTGGLGPTSDDLTAEAVSRAFGIPLEFDGTAYQQIQQYFEKRQRQMAECNRKQALLPNGSVRLDNHWGTAPGFSMQSGRCRFWFLPGVPSEMRQLYIAHVRPMMESHYALQPHKLLTVKTAGIGESELQECINTIDIPTDVQLGFRAQVGEVQIKLLFPATYSQSQIQTLANSVANTIGTPVFAIENPGDEPVDLVSIVDQLMGLNGKTVALVETASQGLLSAKINGAPWLAGAFYYRSIGAIKKAFDLGNHLGDSDGVAKQIAAAIQNSTDADITILQLTDEVDGAPQDKEGAIRLLNFLFEKDKWTQTTKLISGDAKRKQQMAALSTLDFLRRYLQHKD